MQGVGYCQIGDYGDGELPQMVGEARDRRRFSDLVVVGVVFQSML
jgi:hypothetical protein